MDEKVAQPLPGPTARQSTEATRFTVITGSKIAVATIIVLSIIGVALLAIELTRFFMLVFAAVVLAAIFDRITTWLCRITHLNRSLGLTLTVLGILSLFVGAFYLFGTQVAQEFDTISRTVPEALQRLETYLDTFGLGEQARELTALGSKDISQMAARAGGFALAAGSGFADFILVLVAAIFLAADPAVYRRGMLLMIPQRAEPTAAQALDDAASGLQGWMIGQAVSSLVVAALTWAGLAILGVPAAGGLGLIAGLLDVIPMVGPIIAGVPAVLLAFTVSPITALWTLGLFLVIQQLQGNFLQPMIQKHAVDVPPAVLLFAVFAAGLLFGFMGVLLSGPLTVVIFVLVQRIYVRALLGKQLTMED